MKKFAMAAIATIACVGFVMAEEMTVVIQKVDPAAGTITYVKGFGKGFGKKKQDAPPSEPMTVKLAKGAKIAKGEFNFEDKSFKAGEALEKGLANDAFKSDNAKGVFARITTADEDKGAVKKGQVTEILVMQGFGKKKG